MNGTKVDVSRRLSVGSRLTVVGAERMANREGFRIGDVRTVKTVSRNLITWTCGTLRRARTPLDGSDVTVEWQSGDTFTVAYRDGGTITLSIGGN